jgi:hypothetical protein
MEGGQAGEILSDQGNNANEVWEKLKDAVGCITNTAAITLQFRNSKHPSLPKYKLNYPGR